MGETGCVCLSGVGGVVEMLWWGGVGVGVCGWSFVCFCFVLVVGVCAFVFYWLGGFVYGCFSVCAGLGLCVLVLFFCVWGCSGCCVSLCVGV